MLNKKDDIYTNHYYHPQKRNILVNNKYYNTLIEKDLFNIIYHIYFYIFKSSLSDSYKNIHFTFLRKRKHHFFNSISINSKFWIVTYSSSIPRVGSMPKFVESFLVNRLAHKSCRAIIANSNNAVLLQRIFLKENYPDLENIIVDKIQIIHPPQIKNINNYIDKPLDVIKFILVGDEFFRKGGLEVLKALDFLINQGYKAKLVIVSRLEYGDYATKYGKEKYLEAKSIINKYPNNIYLYQSIPNLEVLNLIKECHVGLLPTWADAYGYSVLEFQSFGCPVVTTDIRALPEINDNDIGWVLKVPKDISGRAKRFSIQERLNFANNLESKLKKVLVSIMDNKEDIKLKGINALKKIDNKNNIELFVSKLNTMYNS